MQVIYRAFDGTEFKTEKECSDYEVMKSDAIRMYTWGGKRTNKVEDAVVLHLGTDEDDEDDVASIFIEMCKANGMSSEGIKADDCGWFYWSEYHETYVYIDEDVIEIFAKIMYPKIDF